MIDVKYLSLQADTPAEGYWDHGLINHLFEDIRFRKVEKLKDGGIIVLPARAQKYKARELNEYIKGLSWCIIMLTGDEESEFPVEKIHHPNFRVYVMSPKKKHQGLRYLMTGFPPQAREWLGREYKEPTEDVFFSGQITHKRREEFYKAAQGLDNSEILKTEGFTQGMKPEYYYNRIQKAKIIPAPSGPITADTFRLAEALEAGRIPIADNVDLETDDYWGFYFGAPFFPTIKHYKDLKGYVQDQLEDYTARSNRIYACWQQYKRNLKNRILDNVAELTGKRVEYQITIVIPVSPIPSHPDTKILDETIDTIRTHFKHAEIIITFDGVRHEQEERREDYEKFIAHALWKCNFKWNATPYIYDDHLHQTGMMRQVIDEIKTPLLLYVEQDTPLTPDLEIEWELIADKIHSGESDVVRLHFESVIPDEHQHMIHGQDGKFIRTSQWSQRPHISSVAFYRRILKECFTEDAKSFIEDKMHGVCHEAYLKYGMDGWNQYKIHIYAPDDHLKRSYTTDGREGADKYDSTQTF